MYCDVLWYLYVDTEYVDMYTVYCMRGVMVHARCVCVLLWYVWVGCIVVYTVCMCACVRCVRVRVHVHVLACCACENERTLLRTFGLTLPYPYLALPHSTLPYPY